MRRTSGFGPVQRAAVVLLGVCAPILTSGCGQPTAEEQAANAEMEHLKVVTIIAPTQRDLRRTTTQPATVHALHQAEIHAKVSGYLETLKADIGQAVKKNDSLAVVFVPDLQKVQAALDADVKRLEAVEKRREAEKSLAAAQHRAAEARRDQAAALVDEAIAQLDRDLKERDRIKGLVADMAVAARLLDEAERKYQASKAAKTAADAALISAKAQVEVAAEQVKVADQIWKAAIEETKVARGRFDEAKEMVKYATLKAPFDGIVTERNVDEGDLVRNLQSASDKSRKPLFAVADLKHVRVHVMVPENDAPLVKEGADVSLKLRSLPGREITGHVTRFSHRLDDQTQTMLVEVVRDNIKEDGRWLLFPGMYGEATITLAQKPKALVLPAEAVRFDSQGNSTVYMLNADDTVRIVPVKTGIDFGDEIEIVSGISAGDRIVGPTIGRLKSGQKVRVNSGKRKAESR